jgi:hypothetical protein
MADSHKIHVIPAEAWIHLHQPKPSWIPAFAGMTILRALDGLQGSNMTELGMPQFFPGNDDPENVGVTCF